MISGAGILWIRSFRYSNQVIHVCLVGHTTKLLLLRVLCLYFIMLMALIDYSDKIDVNWPLFSGMFPNWLVAELPASQKPS